MMMMGGGGQMGVTLEQPRKIAQSKYSCPPEPKRKTSLLRRKITLYIPRYYFQRQNYF